MTKYTTVMDIISASADGKPLDVNKFFYDLMGTKTQEYVESKRDEIQSQMFADEDDVEEIELDDEDLDFEVDEVSEDDLDDEQLELALDADVEEDEEDGEDA